MLVQLFSPGTFVIAVSPTVSYFSSPFSLETVLVVVVHFLSLLWSVCVASYVGILHQLKIRVVLQRQCHRYWQELEYKAHGCVLLGVCLH